MNGRSVLPSVANEHRREVNSSNERCGLTSIYHPVSRQRSGSECKMSRALHHSGRQQLI